MTYEITTLGCKVNEYESVYYQEQLEALGLKPAKEGEAADVVVINTCTVTNTAAKKSRQKIRRAKKENPGALCVVVGCYAQTMEEEARKELEADLLIGASSKNQLAIKTARLLAARQENEPLQLNQDAKSDENYEAKQAAAKKENSQENLVTSIDEIHDFEFMPIGHFEGQHRAFLKIQDGCNQYCAYCQIPLARGPERSLMPDDVIQVAKALADKGHKEIVLTGIHTGRYHFRSDNLVSLLQRLLNETPDDVCFRISSIEITEVSDALIALMKEHPRILHHLHIPIQSACNATLARMKRPYTVEQFADRLAHIRKELPDVSVSTDVIAGFVQESDEEFKTTKDNLEKLAFSFLHVFPYSRRKGTAADAMTGFVDPKTAKARTDELLVLSAKLRQQDMERFDKLEVLVERPGPKPDTYSGYSVQYHPVCIQHKGKLAGRVQVQVVSMENGVYNACRLDEVNTDAIV